MPQDNAEHLTPVKKADLSLSYMTGTGGILLPKQAKKFIQLLIKKAKILQLLNVYGLAEPKEELNKMRFGDRVLKPGTPGQALPSGDRARPTFTQTELDAQLFKFEVRIEDEVFEDNIEGPALRNRIMQELGGAISRDKEWIVINGDTTSTDATLAKLDGMLKQATSHTVDAGSNTLDKDWLVKTRKALPHEYKEDPRIMRFFTSVNVEEDFANTVADRATPLGDKYFDEHPGPRQKATPVMGVPEWPEDYGGADTSAVLFLNPKNVHVGVHSKIKFRVSEDAQAGVVLIIGKLRFDVKYENEDAVVKLYDVGIAP